MKTTLVVLLTLFATVAFAAVPPFGTWEWVDTEETPGVFITPADLGYTVQFDFKNDMTVDEYHDQVLFQSGTFLAHDVEFMGVIITALTFDFGNSPPRTCAYGIDGSGYLKMWWGADDGGWPSFPVETYMPRGPVATAEISWGRVKSWFR